MEKADGLEEGEEVQVQERKKGEKKEEEEKDNTMTMQVSGSSWLSIKENLNLKQETVRFHAHCPILTVKKGTHVLKHFCESQVYDGFNVMF